MKMSVALSTFLVGSLMLLASVAPAFAVSNLITTQGMIAEGITNNTYGSSNWCGYALTPEAVTPSLGSVTYVSGSFTVPTVTGPTRGTAYAAFWVGIDGFSSDTVEQTGVLAEIQNGKATYSAWYEFYPAGMVAISKTTGGAAFSVNSGDAITASVSYSSSGSFTTTITDTEKTNGAVETFTSPATKVSGATEASAEWIAEAPAEQIGRMVEVLPLADFGTVSFTACSATLTTGAYTFPAYSLVADSLVVQQITMCTGISHDQFVGVKAAPSAYTPSGGASAVSFGITWESSQGDASFLM